MIIKFKFAKHLQLPHFNFACEDVLEQFKLWEYVGNSKSGDAETVTPFDQVSTLWRKLGQARITANRLVWSWHASTSSFPLCRREPATTPVESYAVNGRIPHFRSQPSLALPFCANFKMKSSVRFLNGFPRGEKTSRVVKGSRRSLFKLHLFLPGSVYTATPFWRIMLLIARFSNRQDRLSFKNIFEPKSPDLPAKVLTRKGTKFAFPQFCTFGSIFCWLFHRYHKSQN